MEENKSSLPAVVTPQAVEMNIKTALVKHKLSIADLQKTGLTLVKNEDHLKEIDAFLKMGKSIKDTAETIFKAGKQPYWDGGKAWDAGKKLVFDLVDTILGPWPKDYQAMLDAIADRDRLAKLKKTQEETILNGIEDNIISFSNKIIAAVNRKQLTEVESLINLQKSPSMAKKYGEFHAQACERFDSVLIPIIKDQKVKVDEIEKLNAEIQAAEAANDPDKMEELMGKVDGLSNEMLQNHAELQDAVLNQESFPVAVAEEVLPEYKIKRTNYSFEISDLEVALKKSRHLLNIEIDGKFARREMDALNIKEQLQDKEEVVVNGIRYIATKVREAL